MSGFKPQVALSELIRQGKGSGSVDERKTKDAYKREKDLEEERKLGLAPACVDVDSGRDINPHIPQFITQTPWYVPTDGPTLKHQRPHWEREEKKKEFASVQDWYHRGESGKEAATKFRKGACENCGSLSHNKKGCFEKPRKLGAAVTGENIVADDYSQPSLKMSWEAKRDRWNGFDPAAYQEVINEHEKQEEVRKIIRAEKLAEASTSAEGVAAEGEVGEKDKEEEKIVKESEEGEDEDKYAEDADMAGVSVDMDSRTRITVRNLRIREDTAKYLYNLAENAPYYDPKSRSMRENPYAGMKGKEKEAANFAGENFIRYSGEVVAANQAQVFAWQARCQGIDVHALAEPTKLEALQKEVKKETKDVTEDHKKKLLEKYGDQPEAPARELLLAQTETYVEYSRKGTVIKGAERPALKSRFEEDVYPNNHTSIFGSYWKGGKWGYKCCHSFVRNSYCIGEKGYEIDEEMQAPTRKEVKPAEVAKEEKEADEKAEAKAVDSSSSSSGSEPESGEEAESDSEGEKERKRVKLEKEQALQKEQRERAEKKRAKKKEKRKRRKEKLAKRDKKREYISPSESSSSSSESDEDATEDTKLQKAVKKAQKAERRGRKEALKDERKRKYNSNYEVKPPTETQMEAYKLTTIHSADPMANFMLEKRRKEGD